MIPRKLLQLSALCVLVAVAHAQYFPNSGRSAIYQRSLDVQGRLNVLSIALRPGYEDLATLAYFRLARGAQIISAYVTNGEAGESDIRGEYPNHLAAIRRTEATDALRQLDGGAIFLNQADIVAAHDTAFVRSIWKSDTLRNRLRKLISDIRPDVILVARDWLSKTETPQLEVLRLELIRALRSLESLKPVSPRFAASSLKPWKVSRVLIDGGSKSDATLPIDRAHPIWKKTYRQIGEESASAYRSLAVQRKLWLTEAFGPDASKPPLRYQQIYPQRRGALRQIDQGLPASLPPRLADLGRDLTTLTSAVLRGQSKVTRSDGRQEGVLTRLSELMQPVDQLLGRIATLSPEEFKTILQWKVNLEDLRVALLGVVVRYKFEPTTLTDRQLATLEIDTVLGIRPKGTTYLYFPTAEEKGWVINEALNKKLDLEFHKPYRVLSGSSLAYHIPGGIYGLQRPSIATSFLFYVIHEGAKREENFMCRVAEPVYFAPRFVTEILTPIVSMSPSERFVVQLTNNSRDGVRDTVYVEDSLATAPKREFRLKTNGSTFLDTLPLTWRRQMPEGTYAIPVKIAGTTVAQIAARSFDVKVDLTKKVALMTGMEESATAEALRRLGVQWATVKAGPQLEDGLSRFRVVIVDRRALSFDGRLRVGSEALNRFVQRGGHLIIMSQDAMPWNSKPLIEGLTLTRSTVFSEETSVEADSLHRLLTKPNKIRQEDWSNWLYQVAYNEISGPALTEAIIPVKTVKEHNALVAQWKRGEGTVTYTDLAFLPQFLNVHAGAYRLLANLISY
jgi:hypothetical protein